LAQACGQTKESDPVVFMAYDFGCSGDVHGIKLLVFICLTQHTSERCNKVARCSHTVYNQRRLIKRSMLTFVNCTLKFLAG